MTNKFTEIEKAKPFTLTENGAYTLTTTGSENTDQFGKAGSYRGRNIYDVFDEQSKAWQENNEIALRLPFYLRLITRKVRVNSNNETSAVQNGQGSRDESFKRLLWIAKEHQDTFNKNIWLLPIVGSWKDLWTLMFYDISMNINAIDRKVIYELLSYGLQSEAHVDLVKKFMPRIKSSSKIKTDRANILNNLAKELAAYLKINFSKYNKLKSTGNAHTFQKIICAREYNKINWNNIPGRALTLLTCGKFLERHNLRDSYCQWLIEQPVAKFTGYPYELLKIYRDKLLSHNYSHNVPFEVKHTLDAQFKGLVEQARSDKKIKENVWCCLDTSSSMNTQVNGLNNVTCKDIAISLALFFAELNTGAFHNKILMFDDTSTFYSIEDESFCDRIKNLPRVMAGGTNFQSAVEEIVNVRKNNPDIPLEDYPTTILVVSDMEFNSVNSWRYVNGIAEKNETNFERSKNSLKEVFPAEFVDNMKFIWWDCCSRYGTNHFEGDSITSGCTFFSGFDGSIINMILGNTMVIDEKSGKTRQMTAEEMMLKALNQEILRYLEV